MTIAMTDEKDNKQKNLEKALKTAKDRFGGALRLGTEATICTHISTSSFFLDLATLGGIPEGFCTVFTGETRTGKTTMAYKCVGNFHQKYPEGIALYVDTENTFDRFWAAKNGVDLERLVIADQNSGEEVVDIIDQLLKDKVLGMIVLDSVAMLSPQTMLDESATKNHVGIPPRLMSLLVRKCSLHLSQAHQTDHKLTMLFINQWSMDLGKMFGDKRVMPAGRKQAYFYHLHIDFGGYKEEFCTEKGYENLVDHTEHKFTIKKNRLGSSIMQGQFSLNKNLVRGDMVEGQVDDAKGVITYAASVGIVEGSGGSIKKLTMPLSGEVHEFRTFGDMYKFLVENPDAFAELKAGLLIKHREFIGLPSLPKDNFLVDREWGVNVLEETVSETK